VLPSGHVIDRIEQDNVTIRNADKLHILDLNSRKEQVVRGLKNREKCRIVIEMKPKLLNDADGRRHQELLKKVKEY
jgi:hypothetical protein